jgi:DNA-binding CsgD family transcriptional regulator
MSQTAELRRIADVIDAGARSAPLPGRLAAPVLHALAALVPSDLVTFLDMEPDTVTYHVDDDLTGGQVQYLSEPLVAPDDLFWRHYHQSLYCSYPTRTGDDRTVIARSDFYSTAQWKQTPMYVDVFRDAGVLFELMCPLPSVGGRSRRLMFFRSGNQDFTEEDRFALALLRPHLAELVGRRVSTVASSSLTERQQELLSLVAEGRTNAEIAVALHLSPHTVRTHLTNIFERLGVTTRAAAVARVLGT